MCLPQIFEFTQRDIDSNSVLFRHRKGDFGRFVFWVRDGKHVVPGNLWPGSYRFLPVLEYIALKATSTRLSLLVVNNSYRALCCRTSTGLFTIQASEPYIRRKNVSSFLLVKKNSSAAIGVEQLQYETNARGLRSDIKFR